MIDEQELNKNYKIDDKGVYSIRYFKYIKVYHHRRFGDYVNLFIKGKPQRYFLRDLHKDIPVQNRK